MVKVKLLTCATDRPDVTGGENCGRQASRREFPGNTGIFRTGTLEKPQPVDFPERSFGETTTGGFSGPELWRIHNRWIFRIWDRGETTTGGFSGPELRRIHKSWFFQRKVSEKPQKVDFPTRNPGSRVSLERARKTKYQTNLKTKRKTNR